MVPSASFGKCSFLHAPGMPLQGDVMKARDLEEVMSSWKGREPMTDVFLGILQQLNDWEKIWDLTRPKLGEYRQKFESVWNPINDLVLSRLSQFSKSEWTTDEIRVHFADCLNGGFAWHDSIAFATLPDVEVQKKFLAHELSELITPSQLVSEEFEREGLDPGLTHTVVDMLAYFSVKDFIAKPVPPIIERKGVVPNKNYYPRSKNCIQYSKTTRRIHQSTTISHLSSKE